MYYIKFLTQKSDSIWGACSSNDIGKWTKWEIVKCTESCKFLEERICLVAPCNGDAFRSILECEDGDCVVPEFTQWSEWGPCECTMQESRNRTCQKTEFELNCLGTIFYCFEQK